MVGQPETPEAAAPEVVGGEDVHDGQDQEQEHPCHTWGRGDGGQGRVSGPQPGLRLQQSIPPILPSFLTSLASRTACLKGLQLGLILEARKGNYAHHRQVCIDGKMKIKAEPLRQNPQAPHAAPHPTWDRLEEPPVELLGKLGPMGQRHMELWLGQGTPPLSQCDSVPASPDS